MFGKICRRIDSFGSNNQSRILNQDQSLIEHKPNESKQQFEYELKAMIDFLSFHPSIISWVLLNEGWGQYDTIRLKTWLQFYDNYRLINAASGSNDRLNIGYRQDM